MDRNGRLWVCATEKSTMISLNKHQLLHSQVKYKRRERNDLLEAMKRINVPISIEPSFRVSKLVSVLYDYFLINTLIEVGNKDLIWTRNTELQMVFGTFVYLHEIIPLLWDFLEVQEVLNTPDATLEPNQYAMFLEKFDPPRSSMYIVYLLEENLYALLIESRMILRGEQDDFFTFKEIENLVRRYLNTHCRKTEDLYIIRGTNVRDIFNTNYIFDRQIGEFCFPLCFRIDIRLYPSIQKIINSRRQ